MAEGVPFYPQTAPMVPDAQKNKAADYVAHEDLGAAFTRGLAAYGNITAQRRNAELEMQRMAQDMALKQEGFGLEKQRLDQDYELKKSMLPYAEDLSKSQAEWHRSQAISNATAAKTGLEYATKIEDRKTNFFNDISPFLGPTDDPVTSGYNWQQNIRPKYASTNLPEVQQGIKEIDKQFADSSIPLPWGITPDANGKFDLSKKDFVQKNFTPYEVVEALHNESTNPIMLNALEAAGKVKRVTTTSNEGGTKTTNIAYPKTEWDSVFKSWVDHGVNLNFKQHSAPLPSISNLPKWRAIEASRNMNSANNEAPLPRQQTPQEWLDANPNDPNAAAIRAKYGL